MYLLRILSVVLLSPPEILYQRRYRCVIEYVTSAGDISVTGITISVRMTPLQTWKINVQFSEPLDIEEALEREIQEYPNLVSYLRNFP